MTATPEQLAALASLPGWNLYDSDTLDFVRPATDPEVDRSLDAGPEGHIRVADYPGRVFAQRG